MKKSGGGGRTSLTSIDIVCVEYPTERVFSRQNWALFSLSLFFLLVFSSVRFGVKRPLVVLLVSVCVHA